MSIQSITEVRAANPTPTLNVGDLVLLDQALRTVAATLGELRAFVRPADATTSEAGLFTAAEKIKLAGVAASATQNQTDSHLLSRANHTGTQAIATVVGLQDALDSKLGASDEIAIDDITGLTGALTTLGDDIDALTIAVGNLTTSVGEKLPIANPQPTGGIRFPEYTLLTLPDEVALQNFVIMVTDATAGRTLCYSDGVDWKIVGTTTTVS